MDPIRSPPEQPDFSTDVRDNGRVLVVVYPLTQAAAPLAIRVAAYFRKLPPFQAAEQREGVLSLRFLCSLPHWAATNDSVKKEGTGSSRRRRLVCVFGVSHCKHEDEVTNASLTFMDLCSRFGSTLLVSRCLIYGPASRLGGGLTKDKHGFVLFDLPCSLDAVAAWEGDLHLQRLEVMLSDCMATVYSKLSREVDQLKLTTSREGRDGISVGTAGQQGDDGQADQSR